MYHCFAYPTDHSISTIFLKMSQAQHSVSSYCSVKIDVGFLYKFDLLLATVGSVGTVYSDVAGV